MLFAAIKAAMIISAARSHKRYAWMFPIPPVNLLAGGDSRDI